MRDEAERRAVIETFLSRAVKDVHVADIPAAYVGKVRQIYDVDAEHCLIVATDRLSAFDRFITTIPLKGQILTTLSRYWFETTRDICPNHAVAFPDPNVTLCRRLTMLPVEVVVRGYLAGSTGTSVLTRYKAGARTIYGHAFPDGLPDNARLPAPIITPTTKAAVGDHDMPLSQAEVVERGLVEPRIWEAVCDHALRLFAHAQAVAAARGLLLVDTKYEFGLAADGTVMVGDEIHTPDSSRFWIADTYEAQVAAGLPPHSMDKDIIRRWLVSQVDAYHDDLPEIPDPLRVSTADVYFALYERITGEALSPPPAGIAPEDRIAAAVRACLMQMRSGVS